MSGTSQVWVQSYTWISELPFNVEDSFLLVLPIGQYSRKMGWIKRNWPTTLEEKMIEQKLSTHVQHKPLHIIKTIKVVHFFGF